MLNQTWKNLLCTSDYWVIHTARDQDQDQDQEWDQDQWVLINHAEVFTLLWDRNKDLDLLFPIVPLPFPVLVPVPVPCSVIKP